MSGIQGVNQAELLKSFLSQSNGIDGASAANSNLSANSAKGTAAANGVSFSKIIMSQLDTDGDGKISQAEMAAGAQKFKSSLSQLNDINAQMRATNAQSQTAVDGATLLSQLDADKDSKVNLVETALTQSAFNKIDTNGDGSISSDELSALIDKANGASSSSSKLKMTQTEGASLLHMLQSKGAATQHKVSLAA